MNKVIGPISRPEWLIMRDIQELIKMQNTLPDQAGLLVEGIKKEKEIYNEVLKRYVN